LNYKKNIKIIVNCEENAFSTLVARLLMIWSYVIKSRPVKGFLVKLAKISTQLILTVTDEEKVQNLRAISDRGFRVLF